MIMNRVYPSTMRAGAGLLVRTTPLNDRDFFATEPAFVEMLLDVEKISGRVWEPACGMGHISKVLEARKLKVRSSDLFSYGYGEEGIDFLLQNSRSDVIITNPPFMNNMAEKFARHAIKLARKKVILLQRLAWLSSMRRNNFFKETRLSRVYVFSYRMASISPQAVEACKTNKDWNDRGVRMIDFAWYVWDLVEKPWPPTLHWIGKS